MGAEGWRWQDSWIFVSLVIAGGAGRHRRSAATRRPEGIRLTDVLATADHLNRSIPERDDVLGAVRRLAGAGLVTVTDGWFRVTTAGEQLWRSRPSSGMGTTVDTVQKLLNRRCQPGDTDWTLDEDEYGIAVQEYIVRLLPRPRRSPETAQERAEPS
ncbi:hypothetical protein [Melissospora conviva]|uniref:hypothetical protein n=1 Tax=Melissospora conviva TaxID=3388432 RepID=UPI003B7F2559